MTRYLHQLREKALALCVAQLLHVAIIHDVRIFRNVSQYLPLGVLLASHSSHKDEACAGVFDLPGQDALVSWVSSRSLPANFCRYKPYCIMYDSTLSGV